MRGGGGHVEEEERVVVAKEIAVEVAYRRLLVYFHAKYNININIPNDRQTVGVVLREEGQLPSLTQTARHTTECHLPYGTVLTVVPCVPDCVRFEKGLFFNVYSGTWVNDGSGPSATSGM